MLWLLWHVAAVLKAVMHLAQHGLGSRLLPCSASLLVNLRVCAVLCCVIPVLKYRLQNVPCMADS